MLIADEPLLALILRFVVDTDDDGVAGDEFLHKQLRVLAQYLTQFPEKEHGARAIEWIGEHAAKYRRDWELNRVADRTIYLRCADCPLAGLDATEHCEIHEQWLYLLHRYLAGEVETQDYVEDCLALLRGYKEQHTLRLASFTTSAAEGKKGKGTKSKGRKGKKNKKKKRRSKGGRIDT